MVVLYIRMFFRFFFIIGYYKIGNIVHCLECIKMYVCVYIYIHTHTHTETHTHTHDEIASSVTKNEMFPITATWIDLGSSY